MKGEEAANSKQVGEMGLLLGHRKTRGCCLRA